MNVLFWSGGKDAWLALVKYREQHPDTDLRLLTTYNEERETVPHQEIHMERIRNQARHLEIELVEVPLPPECPNEEYLERTTQALEDTAEASGEPVEELIFGDWKLEDVRAWREEQFRQWGYRCRFPIWQADLNDLITTIALHPVEVRISAVSEEYRSILRVGETYDQKLVAQLRRLPDEIDPMGEYGEFHTEVVFQKEQPEPRAALQRPV